ncbi:MAG: rhomboid family intramembrane serine protease [Halobacteriaceae archaeon]
MSERRGPRAVAADLGQRPVSLLAASVRGRFDGAPLTWTVFALSVWVFALEAAAALYLGTGTRAVVATLFVRAPWVAWPLAPVLHQRLGHLAANAAVLYVAAPVEARIGRWDAAGLFLAGGVLPLYVEGAKLWLLAGDPHVAAYGASAFGFGLLGCGLALALDADWTLTPRWWLVTLTGVAAVLVVTVDVVTALGAPMAMNLGHLGGLLAGVAVGVATDSE